MAIYVTGDTHIPIDVGKLNTSNWPAQKELTKNDFLIICGDFGAVWSGNEEDAYWLDWLERKAFTTLFIDGNHENFQLLNSFPASEWKGGKVHRLRPSVLHLMRGQVFDIGGVSVFTMGGAVSHDKHLRTEGRSWWPEEMPSDTEYAESERNLERVGWNVDLVITHCAPNRIQGAMESWYERDKLTAFLDVVVYACLSYRHWYFGHYHTDRDINSQHTALYQKIIPL